MTPRIRAILRAPHMAGVAQLPGIAAVTAVELDALEPFVAFCARHRVTAPAPGDIRAYLTLAIPPRPADPAAIETWQSGATAHTTGLELALQKLQFSAALIDAAITVREEVRHRTFYRTHTHGIRRTYQRTVSLPPDALPCGWQDTLRRLRRDQTYSLSVLDRMELRLGMFAWSADQAGHPTDLEDDAAECALFDDLIQRSTDKAIKSGEHPSAARPRWAYLRSTAEELKRFASYHGVSARVMARLDRNYRGFSGLEQRQTPLKMFAALQAPELPVTLAGARIHLEKAIATINPAHRHQRRLKACALGITVACPPRARDVVDRMFWGDGIFYDANADSYAFCYNQSKPGHLLDVSFEPSFNIFFDALLLADNDPRYLPQIRDQAIVQRRPFFIRYEGEPVAYGWFGRAWEEAIGSSSHLARTLLQTFLADLGEDGFKYGQNALGHRTSRHIEEYRDAKAKQISAVVAADTFGAQAKTHAIEDFTEFL